MASSNEFLINEQVFGGSEEIREEAVAVISRYDIPNNLHAGTYRQHLPECAGCLVSPVCGGLAVSTEFGSIDADEANTHKALAKFDIECVAVDHSLDDAGDFSCGSSTRDRQHNCDDGEPGAASQIRSISVPVPRPPPQHIEMRP
jgi:hypothetical protein